MIDSVIERIEKLNFSELFMIDDILGKQFTYREFFSRALSLAAYLNRVTAGDTVIAVKENSFDLALLYFAVMFTDKRIVVIDPQKGADEIYTILSGIATAGLLVDSNISLKGEIRHHLIEMPSDDYDSDISEDVKNNVIAGLWARKGSTPYLVTFTSGTSSVSKGVTHTLDNLFLTAAALNEKVKKEGGTFLHVMPMTYMAGVLNSLFYPFLTGSRIVITKRFSIIWARKFWDIVIKYGVDLFWLSPSMLMMINQMDRTHQGEEYCRSRNLTFLIGTAPLVNEVRTKFNGRYGVRVYASYGLSETLFVSVENDESLEKSEMNSVGELLSGVEYMFSESGEIFIDVPWMYLGYTNEETDKYFAGKYYRTGDLAEMRDGCLYITGRSKDLIIKGGMNISPALIEEVVYKENGIAENVVIGVKDNKGEEKVCCVYTVIDGAENQEAVEKNIRKSVVNSLGKNYILDYLWKVDDIPRNINGKIDKKMLKQMWENRDV